MTVKFTAIFTVGYQETYVAASFARLETFGKYSIYVEWLIGH